MSQGQTRVFVLLLVLLGLEALLSPTVRTFGDELRKGKVGGTPLASLLKTNGAGLPAPMAGLIGYSVGGLALIMLADPAPELATWIVVLLLMLVVLTHSDQIVGFINAGSAGIQALSAGPTSAGGEPTAKRPGK